MNVRNCAKARKVILSLFRMKLGPIRFQGPMGQWVKPDQLRLALRGCTDQETIDRFGNIINSVHLAPSRRFTCGKPQVGLWFVPLWDEH
jgi:hypothetical protein